MISMSREPSEVEIRKMTGVVFVLREAERLHALKPEQVVELRQFEEWLQCWNRAAKPQPPSVVCPRCGRKSFHPRDIAELYCGFCHEWHPGMKP
jgi:hypothetical protein